MIKIQHGTMLTDKQTLWVFHKGLQSENPQPSQVDNKRVVRPSMVITVQECWSVTWSHLLTYPLHFGGKSSHMVSRMSTMLHAAVLMMHSSLVRRNPNRYHLGLAQLQERAWKLMVSHLQGRPLGFGKVLSQVRTIFVTTLRSLLSVRGGDPINLLHLSLWLTLPAGQLSSDPVLQDVILVQTGRFWISTC